MAITEISRDYGNNPQIVRVVCTNSLATITAPNYLYDQRYIINQVNGGPMQWAITDLILIYYEPRQWGFFSRDPVTQLLTIEISGGGGGGAHWVTIAGTTQLAAVNTGYIIGNAAQTTITLPTLAEVGSVINVQGLGAGGWVLQAAAAQIINIGAAATSAGGTLISANRYDSLQIVCVLANSTWGVISVLSTALTIT